jgi:hypothetical protein
MYAVRTILARKGVGLGSESEISNVEQSQMHFSPNMRTNDTKYIELMFTLNLML